jgi:phospholipid transport system substrate-binding protein
MTSRSNQKFFAAAIFLLAFALSAARVSAGVATDQIKATVDEALFVLKDPRLKPAAKTKERRDQLKQVLFARFDFTEMAKRSLGANWRRRTPQEQEEFVRLFTDLLERAYADTIESYTEEKIVYIGEKLDGAFAEVNSKIFTSKGQEFTIDYKTQAVGNEWKVYDVVVENISMVNNYRSQFNRVISNSSFEELILRLKEKQIHFSTQKK